MKKEDRKEAFCSFDRKSNLDLIDSNPSLTDEDVKDPLPFSIPNKLPSILFTKPFVTTLDSMLKPIIIIYRV
jgi:hypothetical protein